MPFTPKVKLRPDQRTADAPVNPPPSQPPYLVEPTPSGIIPQAVQGVGHPVDPDLQFDPDDITAEAQAEGLLVTGSGPSSTIPPWQVLAGPGETFTAALVDPGGVVDHLPPGVTFGARVEAPGTRAIVSAYRAASLSGNMWTVTLDAPLVAGPYQLVWMTSDIPLSWGPSFIPLIAVDAADEMLDSAQWPLIDQTAVRPTVDEIASVERTRTVDQNTGEDKGTFDDTTFPSGLEVESIIDDAVAGVLSVIPDAIDPDYWPRVKWAIVLYTAIVIETSYYRVPNQGPSSGVVLTYRQLYQETMAALETTDIGTSIRLT
jgi:hypothetical protein